MKLLTQILTLVFLTFSFPSFGQISLSVKDKPLDKALVQLEKESGYSFFYNDDLKGLKEPVSVSVKDKDIRYVMDAFLQGLEISYEIKDNKQIALFQKKVAAQSADQQKKVTVTGKITDEKGEPLIGVSVMEEGTNNGSITDVNGQYSITVKPQSILVFNYIGCNDVRRSVSGKTKMNVVMRPSNE